MSKNKKNNRSNLGEKEALTPKQAAYLYGFHEGTLANYRSQKIGPRYYKVGLRKIVYLRKEFEAWLTEHPVMTEGSI